MTHRWLMLAGVLALVGCDANKSEASADESAEKRDEKKKRKKKAEDDAADTKEAKGEKDEAAQEAPPTEAAPTDAPAGEGAPPTAAEWNAQTKEVTVRGSSALGCETKMVRQWLRVSCRGKSDTGGEPTTVSVTKGGGDGKTFTFASAAVTSLVLPFVEGVDVEAVFGWTDKKMKLHVFWPRGAPEPPPKGVFSPL